MCFGRGHLANLFKDQKVPTSLQKVYTIYDYQQAAKLCDFYGVEAKSITHNLEHIEIPMKLGSRGKERLVGAMVVYHEIATRYHDIVNMTEIGDYIHNMYFPTSTKREHHRDNEKKLALYQLYYEFSEQRHDIPNPDSKETLEQDAFYLVETLGWMEGINDRYGFKFKFE